MIDYRISLSFLFKPYRSSFRSFAVFFSFVSSKLGLLNLKKFIDVKMPAQLAFLVADAQEFSSNDGFV